MKGKRGPRPGTSKQPRKKKESKAADEPKKKPRQARLPEMEDPQIEALENAALDYVEIRDERQALTSKEVPAKEKLINLMKKEGKEKYHRAGVTIELVTEKESVKVRVKKPIEES